MLFQVNNAIKDDLEHPNLIPETAINAGDIEVCRKCGALIPKDLEKILLEENGSSTGEHGGDQNVP